MSKDAFRFATAALCAIVCVFARDNWTAFRHVQHVVGWNLFLIPVTAGGAGEPAVAPDRGGINGFSSFNVSPAAAAGERCR